MKYFELDQKEKKILKDFESDKFKRVSDLKTNLSRYQEYARESLNKRKNINIRLSEKDLRKIKVLAMEKGIPYQTLVSSLLHQYSMGKFKE